MPLELAVYSGGKGNTQESMANHKLLRTDGEERGAIRKGCRKGSRIEWGGSGLVGRARRHWREENSRGKGLEVGLTLAFPALRLQRQAWPDPRLPGREQ